MPIILPLSKISISTPYIKSATSERLADSTGTTHDEFAHLYSKLAQNPQIGLIITGHIAVSREARAEPNQPFFTPRDRSHTTLTVRNLKRAVKQVKTSSKTPFIAQISHSGAQTPRFMRPRAVYGWTPVKNALGMFTASLAPPPQHVIAQFSQACETAIRCGFDGVQLHLAHGYLLGDGVNCCPEFVEAVVKECRSVVPKDKIFAVKINSCKEAVPFLDALDGVVDFVEFSAGSYSDPLKMSENHSKRYAAEFSEALKKEKQYKFLQCATGGFYTLQEGQNAIDLNQCDLAGFGRLFCLQGSEKVVRLSDNGRVRQWLRRKLPLMIGGPRTVFYQEILQRRGRGIEKWRLPRFQAVWEGLVLVNWGIGRTRYGTKRAWRK